MNTTTKLLRTIHPEVKVIDATRGIIDYVASDESLDSYREIVLASGWKFTNFKKNSPFVDSHDYGCIEKLLGRVIDFRIEGDRLIERVQWAVDVPENALATLGWKMTLGGYLKAVSVGFYPTKWLSRWEAGTKEEFAKLCREKGQEPESVDRIYQQHEQVELSACILGANPNALAKAMRDGAVSEGEVMKLFRNEPQQKNAPEAPPAGPASRAPIGRSARWFLAELEKQLNQ